LNSTKELRKFGFSSEDIIKEAEKVAPYLKHVHLSDNFGLDNVELPMGMGNVDFKEVMKKLGKKAGPGGCKTQEECGSYCSDQSHIEECINFAGGQRGGLSGERVKNLMGQTQEAREKMRQLQEYKNQQMGGDRPSQFGPPPGGDSSTYGPPPMFKGIAPPEGNMPPEGFRPPENFDPNMMPPEGFIQPEGFRPPEGFSPSPEGYRPPEGSAPPEGFSPNMMPPPTDSQTLPPPPEGNTSMNPLRMLGSAIIPLLDFLSFGALTR